MGYFSNGTEGMAYEAQWCNKCVHQGNCAVWLLHMLYNYDECNNKDSMLHELIPRSKDGLSNEKCTMFHEGKSPVIEAEEEERRIRETINPAYKEWAKERGLPV